MRKLDRTALLAIGFAALFAGSAHAEPTPYRVQYAAKERDFAIVHPAPGGIPLLLMHEAGHTYAETEAIATTLAAEGSFAVLNLEWQEPRATRIWAFDVAQIEAAVGYVRAHAAELGVDASRLAMLGGSRGANLALLSSMDLNAAAPGTVRAIAALSGDADPMETIERAQRGETSERIAKKLSKVYGCEPVLVNCPVAYVEEWSPRAKAAASAAATFLAASQAEATTASLEDEYELADQLRGLGVASEVFAPSTGHGFSYWKAARGPATAFLMREDP
jgi:hypothetical protein